MGTEWSLINTKTKSIFDLSKGGYTIGDAIINNPAISLAELMTVIIEWNYCPNDSDPVAKKHELIHAAEALGVWLAPRLLKFIGGCAKEDLVLTSDADDVESEFRASGFVVTDTRWMDAKYHPTPCENCRSAEPWSMSPDNVRHAFNCTKPNIPPHSKYDPY